MDVPLKHIIGTVALVGLVISASLAYIVIASFVEADVLKSQLNQIAEYVSLNLAEMINLVNFADVSSVYAMMKVLNLPPDLGGRAYTIELIKEPDGGYWVKTQLVTMPHITSTSSIPVNSTRTKIILVTSLNENNVPGNSEKTLQLIDGTTFQYASMVYGGTEELRDESGQITGLRHAVVWGWKVDSTTTWAGIGTWKTTGS